MQVKLVGLYDDACARLSLSESLPLQQLHFRLRIQIVHHATLMNTFLRVYSQDLTQEDRNESTVDKFSFSLLAFFTHSIAFFAHSKRSFDLERTKTLEQRNETNRSWKNCGIIHELTFSNVLMNWIEMRRLIMSMRKLPKKCQGVSAPHFEGQFSCSKF